VGISPLFENLNGAGREKRVKKCPFYEKHAEKYPLADRTSKNNFLWASIFF
jgi:hypothetical protein